MQLNEIQAISNEITKIKKSLHFLNMLGIVTDQQSLDINEQLLNSLREAAKSGKSLDELEKALEN